MKPKQFYIFFVYFLALLVLSWVIHCAIIGSFKNTNIANSLYIDTLYWFIAKLLIWVLFPIFYFKNKLNNPIEFIGLNKSKIKKGIVYGLVASIIWIVFSLLFTFLTDQKIVSSNINPILILYSAFITPFAEELVYRGYIFSGLIRSYSFWKTNLITSILFLVPHLIGYSFQGHLVKTILSTTLLQIFIISIYLGYVRYKSGSLISSMISHSANNLYSIFIK